MKRVRPLDASMSRTSSSWRTNGAASPLSDASERRDELSLRSRAERKARRSGAHGTPLMGAGSKSHLPSNAPCWPPYVRMVSFPTQNDDQVDKHSQFLNSVCMWAWSWAIDERSVATCSGADRRAAADVHADRPYG